MGVVICISNIIDLKIKTVPRDKEGHYIMIKRSIQEDITIINTYVPNIGIPQHTRQILTTVKGEIDSNTIIVRELTPYSQQWTDHLDRKLIRLHRL